jgi:RNA polymerase sigma-70 factor (ECF subfamily)
MPVSPDPRNEFIKEFQAYLETLTSIQIDPRLRSKFGMSDIIQKTLLEASLDLKQLETLDVDGRKARLRKMLIHNLLDEIDRWRTAGRDVNLEKSLDVAAEESSCRLKKVLAAEGKSPSQRLADQEENLLLLEALSKLDARQREALILQRFYYWTLAQIAEHLGCTTGAVAGLQARGLQELRKYLPDAE